MELVYRGSVQREGHPIQRLQMELGDTTLISIPYPPLLFSEGPAWLLFRKAYSETPALEDSHVTSPILSVDPEWPGLAEKSQEIGAEPQGVMTHISRAA